MLDEKVEAFVMSDGGDEPISFGFAEDECCKAVYSIYLSRAQAIALGRALLSCGEHPCDGFVARLHGVNARTPPR